MLENIKETNEINLWQKTSGQHITTNKKDRKHSEENAHSQNVKYEM